MKEIFALICALALAKADPVRTNVASYDKADPKQAPLICATFNSDGVLIAHEICNQFYQCWNGEPVVRRCYGDLQYNPSTEVCDWPHTVDCGYRIIPAEETDNGAAGNVVDKEIEEDSSSGTGNCDPSQAGSICASEGSEGTLVAHENCNRYYICNQGLPVVQNCPGILLFDPSKNYCDWPEKVDCGDRTICVEDNSNTENGDSGNGDSGNGNGESDTSENGGHGAGNCDPSQAESICASKGSEGTLVAHENCNKYYICNYGVPVVQRCPGTLLFDPFKDYCDWPEKVDCGDRVICEEDDSNSGNDDTGNEDSGNGNGESGNGGNGGNGAGNCDPSQAESICASEGSEGTLVAHENCNKYYICNYGVPVVQRCPGTLLFDPFKDYCDWPENVDCGDRVISEEDDSNTGNDDSGNGGSGNGNGESENGSNAGNGAGNCDPSQAENICASEESEGTLVAHENCNKYYICNHGVPVVQTCPGTLLFDPFKDYCDWPENVNCGERTISDDSEEVENGGNDNGSSSENGGSDNGGSDNGGSDNGGSGTCNCNPAEAPEICAVDRSDGTLVAHENCNQFYICSNGKTVTVTCPGATLYNPHTEVCDWPDNVDCGDRVIPEAGSEEDNNGNGGNDNGGSDNGSSSENGGSDNGGSDNGGSDNGGTGTCNCNPAEAPEICAADGSDGTLVAQENCNQFYICSNGKPVTVTCPGTTLYNPHTEVCDWPDNVDCGDRVIPEAGSVEDNNENGGNDNGGSDNGSSSENGGSDNGGSGTCNCNPTEAPEICAADGTDGTLVAHENCNQFYICSNGKPVTVTCPGTTLYNPHTEVCDWPDNVDCGDRVIPEAGSEEDNNGNGGNDNGGSDNGSSSENEGSDNGGSGTCNCNPTEAPEICAADGSDGTLVAHENCNQFYICSNGKTVTVTCPGATLYNPHTEVCDWPDNVDCGDRVIPEAGSEEDNNGNGGNDNGGSDNGSSSENGGSDNGGSGTCNCNPTEAPEICAADGSDGTLVAHENCNQFYICSNGKTVTVTCPGATLYNPHTEVCDWPDNVDCGDRVILEAGSEEDNNGNGGNDNGGSDNENSSENGGSDNEGSGTCNCNPAEAPEICAADGSDGTLVAHENCNQFYICSNGKPVTVTCPGTTLYNPHTEVCDWPDNVDCGDRVIPEAGSEEDNNGNGGNDNSGSDNGSSSENGGSDNGGSDNGGSGTCNCNPAEAPEICAADGTDGTLVAHENCNQFYICSNGKTVTVTCPGTTLYNPHTEVCDWSNNVNCGDRVIPEAGSEEDINGNEGDNGGSDNGSSSENEGSDNGGSDNGSSDNGGSDNGESDNGGSGTCNCNPSEAPEICAADGSDGTLVAHENCNQFYICSNGKTVTVTCPGATLYNPHTEVCDWPDNVDCGDRVIPEAGSEEDNNGNGGNDNGGSDNGSSSENGGSDNGGSDNGGSGTCNCNPAEAPEICAADGSDGTLVAHENCNQFYICSYGKTVTVTCPGTTLYNPHTEVCDWPDNVDCGDRVIPESGSEEDNNGNGDNGGSDNGGTDNGGTDNGGTDNGGTDNGGSDNGDSDNGGNDSSENVSSDNENSDNGGSDNGDSDNGGSGNCNCNPAEAPEICATDGSDGTLVAHENCNQFYTCVGGKPVTLTCPGITLYNPHTEVCDWPDNVDCGDRVIPEAESEEDNNGNGGNDNGGSDNGSSSENGGSDNGGSDNGGSDNGGSGTCNCNPAEAPEICATDGSDGTLVAHENCNQFYTCVGGKPVTLTCPGITLYNPHTEVCDWPDNVDCGDRVISEAGSEEDNNGNGGNDNGGSDNGGTDNGGTDNGGTDNGGTDNGGTDNGGTDNGGSDNGGNDSLENVSSDNENSDNGGSDNGDSDNGGSSNCNCNPAEAPEICATDGSDGALIAHENCNQFYTCVGGKTVTLTCPGITLYNPHTEICDWPHNVQCGDRTIPEAESEEDNNGNGGTDNDDLDNGSIENTENGGSESNCNCNPAEAPEICAADGSDGAFVAHENCNQFYTCVAGKPVTLTCAGSTLYNPHTERCDWPENVSCGDRVIPADCDESDNSDNGSSDDSGTDNGGSDNGGSGVCNCDPAEAPAICAADGSDGAFVAHENCNQFYTCVAGKPVTLTCAGTTLYNPYTERCDWPENVSCGDRVIPADCDESDNSDNGDNDNGSSDDSGTDNGGSDNEGFGVCNCDPAEAPAICAADGSDGAFVAHENCNQFYTCVAGKPVTLTCAGTTLYNPHTERCDWPENVICGDRVIPADCDESDNSDNDNGSSDDSGTDNGSSDDSGTDNGGSDNGGSGVCNCDPAEAPAICAADGSDGSFVAHENCNQFYICLAGTPVTLTCAGSTLYNPHTERCDWPENVSCGDRVIPADCDESDNSDNDNGSSDDSGTDNGGSDNGGSGVCNCDPAEAPAICAADGSDGAFVAHENCNQFYNCVAGKPVTLTCAGTTLYNPHTERCDWPENVICGDRVIPADCDESDNSDNGDNDNGSSDDSGTDNGGSDNGGSGVCNCDPAEAPAICAADGSDGAFVAHENCNQFYTCLAGKPVTLTCAGSTLYNPHTERCDWPENVSCGDRVIPADCDESDNSDNDNGSSDDSGTDNGGSDNGGSGVCNCDPAEAPAICAADGSDGAFVAHENCNQFYTCVAGKPLTLTCAGTTLYNPYTERCDWPENVSCGDRVIPADCDESDNSDNGDNDNGSSDDSGTDNGGSDNGGSGVCNCDPAEAPAICAADGSDGAFVAHENCNQFYTCLAGKPVTLTCAGSTLYNPHTERCDWPENVSCGDRVIPADCDESDNSDNDNGSSDDSGTDNGGSENSGSGVCNCDPAEAPAICAADGSDGAFVAHGNCNQFYTCLAGKPVTLTCAGTTLYNPYTERCDWPENVKCGDRIILEDCDDNSNNENNDNNESGNIESEKDTSDSEESGSYNDNPAEAPEICAADGSDGAFIAHEKCNQFYTCLGGKPVTISCAGVTLYNPSTQRCDWPDNVNCGNREIPDDYNEGAVIEDEGTVIDVKATCAASGAREILLPHENCNQFYVCIDNEPVEMTCSGTQLYNQATERCDWPQNVVCKTNNTPIDANKITEEVDDDIRVVDGLGDADESDTEHEDGLVEFGYDVAVKRCAEAGSDNVIVPHQECQKFYVCISHSPVEYACGSNTLYDMQREQCNHPQNVDCGTRT